MMDIDELKENVLALKNEAKEEYEEAVDFYDFYGKFRYETEEAEKKYKTLEQVYKLLDEIC